MAFGPGVGRDLPGDTDEPERTSLPKQVIRQCTFPSPPSLGDTSAPSCPVDRRWAERRACRGSSRINSTMTATDLEQRNANLVGGGTSALHQQLIFRPIPGSGRAGTPSRLCPGILGRPPRGRGARSVRCERRPGGVATLSVYPSPRLTRQTHRRASGGPKGVRAERAARSPAAAPAVVAADQMTYRPNGFRSTAAEHPTHPESPCHRQVRQVRPGR